MKNRPVKTGGMKKTESSAVTTKMMIVTVIRGLTANEDRKPLCVIEIDGSVCVCKL